MKNLIRKILKEDEWDWVENTPAGITKDYFVNRSGVNSTSYSKIKAIQEDYELSIVDAIKLLWNSGYIHNDEDMRVDAENVFIWDVLIPEIFDWEIDVRGRTYVIDIDQMSGSVSFGQIETDEPTNFIYATPNYDVQIGKVPIDMVSDDGSDYTHITSLEIPKFQTPEEMMYWYEKEWPYLSITTVLNRGYYI